MTANGDSRGRSKFSRYIGRVSTWFGYASALLILASVLVITYATVLRYVVGSSTVWQTELSIYFLLFAAFCGAAYGLKHGDHVGIDLVLLRLGPRTRRVVRIVAALLGFVLVTVIAVMAFGSWWETVQVDRHSGTAWNPSLILPHLIVPVGMVVLALQFLAIAVDLLHRRESESS
jgi:TRAP-type C4-dicarboxylate transport system permease small subunit